VTNAELIERSIARLGLEASDAHTDADLEPLVDDALKGYFTSVATGDDDGKRQLIFADYTVALTAGVGSLATHYTSGLIPAAHKHWRVLVAGETLLSSWLPDRQSINMGRNKLVSFFCADGSTLRTRDRTGSLTGFTAVNATVSGPSVLAIGSVPEQLESELIDTFVEIVKGRVTA
jgi:hypothetical protein